MNCIFSNNCINLLNYIFVILQYFACTLCHDKMHIARACNCHCSTILRLNFPKCVALIRAFTILTFFVESQGIPTVHECFCESCIVVGMYEKNFNRLSYTPRHERAHNPCVQMTVCCCFEIRFSPLYGTGLCVNGI